MLWNACITIDILQSTVKNVFVCGFSSRLFTYLFGAPRVDVYCIKNTLITESKILKYAQNSTFAFNFNATCVNVYNLFFLTWRLDIKQQLAVYNKYAKSFVITKIRWASFVLLLSSTIFRILWPILIAHSSASAFA